MFRNLEDLKAATARLGGMFHEGQKSYRWYNTWVDDTPVPKGMFENEEDYKRMIALPKEQRKREMTKLLGHCDHAISFQGATFDVGVSKRSDGSFHLQWDYYGQRVLDQKMGRDGGMFAQAYGVEAAKRAARRKGWIAREQQGKNGQIVVEVLAR